MPFYPNAVVNAKSGAMHPPLSAKYQAREIEFYIGDASGDSVCHFKDGKLLYLNIENAKNEPVYQVLIDNSWAYIEADGKILLDRLNGFILPQIPKQRATELIAKKAGVTMNPDIMGNP